MSAIKRWLEDLYERAYEKGLNPDELSTEELLND
jgi:hypothetical protein